MSYIPNRWPDRYNWSLNYTNWVNANGLTRGLSAPQITALGTAFDDYQTAWMVTQVPATRTTPALQTMYAAWQVFYELAIAYADILQANPSMTDTDRADAGLTVRDTAPSPIAPPTEQPDVSINRLLPLQVELRIKTLGAVGSAKPPGSVSTEIWRKVDGPAPATIDDCEYVGSATKRFFLDTIPVAGIGKPIHYLARFKTRTQLVGPTSSNVTTTGAG